MNYLTENPWPLAVMIGLVAVFFAWNAIRSGQSKLRNIAVIVAVLAVIPFVTDQLIQTDREVITKHLTELRDAVVSGNANAALAFVDSKDQLPGSAAEQIQRGMDMVNVHDNLHLKGVQVEVSGAEATSDFRANGTVDVKNIASGRHVATRWRLTWSKRATEWKITLLERLDPLNGEVIGVFSGN